MRIISFIVLIILLLLGVSFAILNAGTVTINYYIGTHPIPLSLLLILTLGIGMLVGLLASIPMLFRSRTASRRLGQRAKMAEKEVENLRAIPLKNEH